MKVSNGAPIAPPPRARRIRASSTKSSLLYCREKLDQRIVLRLETKRVMVMETTVTDAISTSKSLFSRLKIGNLPPPREPLKLKKTNSKTSFHPRIGQLTLAITLRNKMTIWGPDSSHMHRLLSSKLTSLTRLSTLSTTMDMMKFKLHQQAKDSKSMI